MHLHFFHFFHSCIAEEESQQQSGMKPKPSAQQVAAESDAGAIGVASQSPVDTANPQQSQDLVNNSSHQMVSVSHTQTHRHFSIKLTHAY